MPDYNLGKIYRIVCNTTGLVYYGSTTEKSLSSRLRGHRCGYKDYVDGKRRFITSFSVIENDNFNIELVENYPCTSKEELHRRERFYIENNDCVNKFIPTRTGPEYYQQVLKFTRAENIESVKESNKRWRDKNKEYISKKNRDYKESHEEELKEYRQQYREEHKDEIKEYMKAYKKDYIERNKEKIKEQNKQYFLNNKEEINRRSREKYEANKVKINERRRELAEQKKNKV
jgi:hypothetical protein